MSKEYFVEQLARMTAVSDLLRTETLYVFAKVAQEVRSFAAREKLGSFTVRVYI